MVCWSSAECALTVLWSTALHGMVVGVCDFLADAPGAGCERQMQMELHLESESAVAVAVVAVVMVVRWILVEGLTVRGSANVAASPERVASPELIASAVSWAIYGAAREWVNTPGRVAMQEIAPVVVRLVAPMMGSGR